MNFSNLFGPAVGLGLIATRIEKMIDHKITRYVMVYNGVENSLSFIVELPDGSGRHYPYDDSEGLCGMIKTMAKEKLKEGQIIDLVKVYWNISKECSFELYYKDADGSKLKLNNKL